ncbi:MAG: hypothetical protein J7L88_03950 [Thermoplasmata archaeon]|nr:hypothetical protein [Thermoplasmata archaeon]
MSPQEVTFESVEEFLDNLPETPCSRKLGEPFCSLCERVNRRVAMRCRYSRLFQGEAPSEGEVEEEKESHEGVKDELKLRKEIKEKGLPEIEIIPAGGDRVIEMHVEGGEVVFKKATEAELEFAKIKKKAQESLVEIQSILSYLKELGYGLEDLRDEVIQMANNFREMEYEKVISQAEDLKRRILKEENMKNLKESVEALVDSLLKMGKAGDSPLYLKEAIQSYEEKDYVAFLKHSAEIMKEMRKSGVNIVIGVPLEVTEEEVKPVKKVVKKTVIIEGGEEIEAEEVKKSTTPPEEEPEVKGGVAEKKEVPLKRPPAKKVKKAVKKVKKVDQLTLLVQQTYEMVDKKRKEGKDVSQILDLLAMVDKKRREGDKEFALKLAKQSYEMAQKI